MERAKLVCTQADMTNLKNKMQKLDIVELCTRERANTNWKFYKLTNLTIFASLLKDVPKGCKDPILPEPLSKNQNVNCLTFGRNTRQPYKDNLCLFRAIALHLHGNEKLEEETSKIFNLFFNNSEEGDVSKFQAVHLNDIPKVEDLLQLNIFLYDIDLVDGELIGELCRRSIQKYEKSVKLLRYNNHICYVNALFKAFRCTTCDKFFTKTGNLERHLVTCSDRVKHIYPKNVYELRELLFEKLDAFNIPYKNEQKLFKNLTIFDFETVCVREVSYKQTETTTWIKKHVPISVSISSNLIPEPIFLCNANPHHLISSFITVFEGLATQSKAEMKWNFLEVETAIKIKLCAILEQLNQRRNRGERVSNFVDDCLVEEKEEKDLSTQFLQMQKNQLIDLQERFERYCNVLPVFGFNSAKYDINLIKSYLLPILLNERDIKPTVIKKANQIVSFKLGDIQLLDIMNFLGGATSLDSFLKAYKTKGTKGFFPYEWFDCPEKMNKEPPPYDSFFSILRNSNPLENDYNDFQNLVNSGLTTEQAVSKLRMERKPPAGAENYLFLQSI